MENSAESPLINREALKENLRLSAQKTVESILQQAGLDEVIAETTVEDGRNKATSWENNLTVVFKTQSMKSGDSLWVISMDDYDKPEKENRLRELVEQGLETIRARAETKR